MSTAPRRDAHFQEIAVLILTGFSDHFPIKNGPFLGLQKRVFLGWFGLVWPPGLAWPPLASLGLSLASPWPPLGLLWLPLGLPWPPLGFTFSAFGLPLAIRRVASKGVGWPG